MATTESEGQKRMLALHGGTRDDLEVSPNLWAGVGLARGGAGTALVGSHAEVADRIEEYRAIGIDEFILSGYPHLEELYWFGEGVLPILEQRGAWVRPRPWPRRMHTGSIAVRRRGLRGGAGPALSGQRRRSAAAGGRRHARGAEAGRACGSRRRGAWWPTAPQRQRNSRSAVVTVPSGAVSGDRTLAPAAARRPGGVDAPTSRPARVASVGLVGWCHRCSFSPVGAHRTRVARRISGRGRRRPPRSRSGRSTTGRRPRSTSTFSA